MTENEAREEICRVGRSLFERGYVHATAGNISLRLDDGFLITPTDACLGFLDPARLARLDGELRQTGGDRASKTIGLHARIYEAARRFDPATRCVIHTHSSHCVALTLLPTASRSSPPQPSASPSSSASLSPSPSDRQSTDVGEGELLPALTPYFVMKVGHVPRVGYHRPGALEAAERVAELIARYGEEGRPIRAVMLDRLGPNVWHDSPASAMAVLEELEETAKLRLLAGSAHPIAELSPAQIDELRRTFGARW